MVETITIFVLLSCRLLRRLGRYASTVYTIMAVTNALSSIIVVVAMIQTVGIPNYVLMRMLHSKV